MHGLRLTSRMLIASQLHAARYALGFAVWFVLLSVINPATDTMLDVWTLGQKFRGHKNPTCTSVAVQGFWTNLTVASPPPS